jgi:hypothetical protein
VAKQNISGWVKKMHWKIQTCAKVNLELVVILCKFPLFLLKRSVFMLKLFFLVMQLFVCILNLLVGVLQRLRGSLKILDLLECYPQSIDVCTHMRGELTLYKTLCLKALGICDCSLNLLHRSHCSSMDLPSAL